MGTQLGVLSVPQMVGGRYSRLDFDEATHIPSILHRPDMACLASCVDVGRPLVDWRTLQLPGRLGLREPSPAIVFVGVLRSSGRVPSSSGNVPGPMHMLRLAVWPSFEA